MSKETTSIQFTCHNCGKENKYSVIKGNNEGNIVIKRCMNCSAENKIELPEGYIANPTETVFRGMKKD